MVAETHILFSWATPFVLPAYPADNSYLFLLYVVHIVYILYITPCRDYWDSIWVGRLVRKDLIITLDS